MEEKEEKKKRWRPSLGLYREQLSKIASLSEEVERLKKFKVEHDSKVLRSHIAGLEQENNILKRSNGYMEVELQRVNKENDALRTSVRSLKDEIFVLMHRGWWARLLNREV
jgi:chromosome segregation ATPase